MSTFSKFVFLLLFLAMLLHELFDKGNIFFQPVPYADALTTLVLFGMATGLYFAHAWEINRKESEKKSVGRDLRRSLRRLNEAYRYIGLLNRQLPLLKTVTTDLLTKLKKNNGSFKSIFEELLATASTSVLKAEWGFFRFIEINRGITEKEFFYFSDQMEENDQPQIGNKELLETSSVSGYFMSVNGFNFIRTSDHNTACQCFFIFPKPEDQERTQDVYPILQSIVDQAQLFYRYLNI